jgi:hypothetical protein
LQLFISEDLAAVMVKGAAGGFNIKVDAALPSTIAASRSAALHPLQLPETIVACG